MTRKEQLNFCRKCIHREVDIKNGLKCGITHELADFDKECPNFQIDETVTEIVLSEEDVIKPDEVVTELNESSLEKLKFHQDFYYALMGGLLAMVISGVIWAVITVATEYQIGFMAIGVGLVVGYAVRFFGAGIDAKFGYLGAVLSLLGCALGNLFSQVGFIAQDEGLGYLETVGYLNIPLIGQILAESFNPMDILFYGIAVFEGYKFAFRKITIGTLQQLNTDSYDGKPENHKLRMPLAIGGFLILSVFFFKVSRGVSGPKTYYYESGEVMSKGELKNNNEVGEWTYYYENGEIQAEAQYKEDQPESAWKWYDESGNLISTGSYKNELEHGIWISYYLNGTMSDSGNYLSSRTDGLWKYWYESGSIFQTGYFSRNKQDSLWTTYYENGNLMSRGNMLEGSAFGFWQTYYENGQLSSEITYDSIQSVAINNIYMADGTQIVAKGEGLYKTHYDNGQLYETGRVKAGKRIGIWTEYFEDGRVKCEYKHEADLSKIINLWSQEGAQLVENGTGDYVSVYDDGSVYENGKIKSGLREGKWLTYYPDSEQLFQELEYKEGVLDGLQVYYFENGQASVTGLIDNDLRVGEWAWYYENGNLSSTAVFKNGKKQGEQKMYSEFGELSKIEVYEGGVLVSEKFN